MDKDIAGIWVKALRSGNYEQGSGNLQNMNGFCCLGVLCDLGSKNGVTTIKTDDRLVGNYLSNQKSIVSWSGVGSTKGDFGDGVSLADLNDGGTNFNELADLIEKHWPEL